MTRALTLFLTLSLIACSKADDEKPAKPKVDAVAAKASEGHKWAEWVEPDFPFFSSVLDARDAGKGFPKDNLTPRGLILNLGHNLWACFDTDLLRIACIWQGEEGKPPVTPEALAPGSYHIAGQKTKDGQDDLPKPVGKVLLANGIYPGWQVLKSPDDMPNFTDPREPSQSKEEVGRGSLLAAVGQIKSIYTMDDGVKEGVPVGLKLEVEGVTVSLSFLVMMVKDGIHLTQMIGIDPTDKTLAFVVGDTSEKIETDFGFGLKKITQPADGGNNHAASWSFEPITPLKERPHIVSFPPHKEHLLARVSHFIPNKVAGSSKSDPRFPARQQGFVSHWPQTLTTKATLAVAKPTDAYVLDDIPLPLDNPWKRNLRIADIAFLDDKGNAAAVSFDGDVWLVSGLNGDLAEVKWKRFASGLHEPMSIVARKGELFVFDRNGIWKLRDTNNDREADVYEMFCNQFGQTAETREFPNSMKLAPDGSFVISKGGQEGTTFGKDNGKVLRISADGKTVTPLGYGLRQPFIGVHPKTGLVTASDQQGNYVPSTPIQIIRDNQFYGHLPTIAPKEIYPATIAEPVAWIPHPVNPSGVTQTWLVDAKMGPLNDECIHIGYNRPELFRVLFNNRLPRPQATVMSFWRDFELPPLNATVNPADGQLYVTGFQVWGTTSKKISGLARIRYTGAERVLLKECTPTDKGILLRFTHPLDPKFATDPASYSAERWNYKRTPEYGSPHVKLDGSTGQEWMNASSAYLSKDGKTVLVGIPDMKAGVHQMRIGWGLQSVNGSKAQNTAYFTPWDLLPFDAAKEGFENITVDLTPRSVVAAVAAKPTVEEGERLYQMIGCMACHSIDGTTVGKVGPSWKGIFNSEREIAKGMKGRIKADEGYLRESIVNPAAKVVKGFEKFDAGMPIYDGILNDSQIESLVLYIKSLK
jgi:cytochrome c551/c552